MSQKKELHTEDATVTVYDDSAKQECALLFSFSVDPDSPIVINCDDGQGGDGISFVLSDEAAATLAKLFTAHLSHRRIERALNAEG